MRIDPDGVDLGWFALDRDGHIGFFTSSGSRVVPETVLASRESLELLDKEIRKLPQLGKGSLRGSVSGNCKDWIEMAGRGLVAYDFKSHDTSVYEKGDYELIATPSQPSTIDSLDKEIGRALRALTMKTICFTQKKLIKQDLIQAL